MHYKKDILIGGVVIEIRNREFGTVLLRVYDARMENPRDKSVRLVITVIAACIVFIALILIVVLGNGERLR